MQKKFISLASVVLSVLLVYVSSIPIYAESIDIDEMSLIHEELDEMEKILSDSGTDVVRELSNQVERLNQLLETPMEYDDRQQILELIESTYEAIDDYTNYSSDSTISMLNNTRSNATLSAAVATVIAYFNAQGYYLSAELLTHARSNSTVNSTYSPSYGYKCNGSPLLAQIWNGSSVSGTGSFPKSGTATDLDDLYYAIHAFSYTKTYGSGLNSSYMTVTDRYDYATGDYTGVGGVAVNTMYQAQQAGILVPYIVSIRVNPNSLIWL